MDVYRHILECRFTHFVSYVVHSEILKRLIFWNGGSTYEAEYVYSYIRSSPFEMYKKTFIECSALMCRVNSYKTEKFDYYDALSLAD